jgi:hypothetical protein
VPGVSKFNRQLNRHLGVDGGLELVLEHRDKSSDVRNAEEAIGLPTDISDLLANPLDARERLNTAECSQTSRL